MRLAAPGRAATISAQSNFKEEHMKIRHLVTGAGLAGALLLGGASIATAADATTAAAPLPKNRVVIQVSEGDPKNWNLALNNARNLQQALGEENVAIEIVAYGAGGIGMLKKDSVVGSRVADARAKGVTIVACENTMKGVHLTYDDMLPTIGYVPGGVVEIMEKQQQGWTYIRP
jgi:intracellular sulfur oxidation DsrE/DsrF family protein